MVKSLGDTVACTITIHHLYLVVDDWAGCCHNFCKPVAKFPHDRQSLRQIILDGHPRFFLGTDSAPHPKTKKEGPICAAGIYTTPFIIPYLVSILDSFGALNRLNDFATKFGRNFYGIEQPLFEKKVWVVKEDFQVPFEIKFEDEFGNLDCIIPFLAGKTLKWKLR
jgi:dihydroorotase